MSLSVTLMDSDEVVALVAKFNALVDALKAMRMTCHKCSEKQTLSLGVTQALEALQPKPLDNQPESCC